MKIRVLVRKFHKWLALIVGIQVLLWTASGLFMSFVPIEKIRSEHLAKKPKTLLIEPSKPYLSIGEILKKSNAKSPVEINLTGLSQKYVYEVKHKDETELFDAITGEKLSPIDKELAAEIAMSHFSGESKVKRAYLIEKPVIEFRGKLPVWRIDFNNEEGTSFYISPENGKLLGRRSSLWRIYDFMWMLHIMDYEERENFNHWWLVLAAFLAVSMSFSGLWLIAYSFRKRDFNFLKGGH
ncbi:MAG: PepSY domain-containing protein [Bdellovibrionales bacterium]|nr:PepSY domain-containing protein [Bdellovibrionales bacterium]